MAVEALESRTAPGCMLLWWLGLPNLADQKPLQQQLDSDLVTRPIKDALDTEIDNISHQIHDSDRLTQSESELSKSKDLEQSNLSPIKSDTSRYHDQREASDGEGNNALDLDLGIDLNPFSLLAYHNNRISAGSIEIAMAGRISNPFQGSDSSGGGVSGGGDDSGGSVGGHRNPGGAILKNINPSGISRGIGNYGMKAPRWDEIPPQDPSLSDSPSNNYSDEGNEITRSLSDGDTPTTISDTVGGGSSNGLPYVVFTEVRANGAFDRCAPISVCVGARDDVSGSLLDFEWAQAGGPEPFAGPFVTHTWIDLDITAPEEQFRAECVQFVPDAPGVYVIEVTVFDYTYSPELGYAIRTEEWLALEGDPNPYSRLVYQVPVTVWGSLSVQENPNPEVFQIVQDGTVAGTVRPLNLNTGGFSGFYWYWDGDPMNWQCATGDEEPVLFSYNGHFCDPRSPVATSNQAITVLVRTTDCGYPWRECTPQKPGLSVILDSPHDGTGGAASMSFVGFGEQQGFPDYFWNLDDYPFDGSGDPFSYDAPTDTTTIDWTWPAGETDGVVMSVASWDECVTITPNFQSGIDSWVVYQGDRETPPTPLDMTKPLQLCPLCCRDVVDLPGDADRDGDVDGSDFLMWQANVGTQSGATWAQGDFDGDGDVDTGDLALWQDTFGQTR